MARPAIAVAILWLVALVGPVVATSSPDPLEPASSGGIAAVDRALARLSIHARLLIVGAHPDDEDNALLTYVSRGLGGEAAYLSLSRGEGGQNLIGSELGEPLGWIRTGELMAARRIEGTRQYFARAYDFGYTRSLEEAFERWPREVLREDAIRAARRFKPQVIVSIFPADARAGHGQHQASAVIARDIYALAGDADRFLDLKLPPWSPSALYRRAWSREEATVGLPLGGLDPIAGRSLGQLAAESRSQHRSQDMGSAQRLGEYMAGLKWIEGGAGEAGDDPFAGVETSLAAIAGTLPSAEQRERVGTLLDEVEELARSARERLNPAALDASVPAFQQILERFGQAIAGLGHSGKERAVTSLLLEKVAIAERGLAAAAGVIFDAVTDRETLMIGEAVRVTASIWPSPRVPVEINRVELRSAVGWRPAALADQTGVEERGVLHYGFDVEVPEEASASTPYYLALPRAGDLYDWSDVPEALRGEPLRKPLIAVVSMSIAGMPVLLEREVVYRTVDQAFGEVRQPLRAVSPVEVGVRPDLAFVPSGVARNLEIEATLKSNAAEEITGLLRLEAPEGWPHVPAVPLTLEPGSRDRQTFELTGVAPEAGLHELRVTFELDAGGVANDGLQILDYPHVRRGVQRVPAVTRVRALPLSLPELERVGYVPGASDRVPALLEEIGVPVESLNLGAGADLSGFDAIVIGSRAYEIDDGLRANNAALMRYVEEGGLLIVQYQQYQFVRGGYAPLPLDISRPHGRITDETSPVRVLEPDHPAFHRPNRIDSEDWEGWVQERGLYFAGEWDEGYQPLLALQDPGDQPEQRGGLLVARVGAGTYVYTGLSFFRELPAGVPGAFRLFANLLALGDHDAD